MVGGTHGRRWLALALLAVVGCVGLGDSSSRVRPQRSRAKQDPEQSSPPLRMPEESSDRKNTEIPLVPVPPLPLSRTDSPPPPAQATAPKPTTPTQQADGSVTPPAQPTTHTARQLLEQAAARCKPLDSYIVRLTRREFVKGKVNPEEIMCFKFRRQPFSVHFKWLGETSKGREVIYVKDRYDNKIHTKLAAGDAPLMPAGTRWSVAPDSMLARSASRHPITNAGICHCVQSMVELLDAQERGDRRQGTLAVIAPQRRSEYPRPVEAIERIIPPGIEPELPRGGRRIVCFDPEWQLPMLVFTTDDTGREVEYYRYDRLQTPVNLDDDDFNPDKVWSVPRPKAAGGPNPAPAK